MYHSFLHTLVYGCRWAWSFVKIHVTKAECTFFNSLVYYVGLFVCSGPPVQTKNDTDISKNRFFVLSKK